MRVRLDNPGLVASLFAFLCRQGCIVEQIATDTLAVWCPPAHENGSEPPSGELTCRNCGTSVADALGRLGSLRCHDCRDEALESLLPGVYGLANGNGNGHRARGDLAAYVAEWKADHAGARPVIA